MMALMQTTDPFSSLDETDFTVSYVCSEPCGPSATEIVQDLGLSGILVCAGACSWIVATVSLGLVVLIEAVRS